MIEHMLFTDNWWNAFIHEYAYTLFILWALLKTLAKLDPTNKSDDILESFRALLFSGPPLGRRVTDQKDTDREEKK